jgi:hypothetical protein
MCDFIYVICEKCPFAINSNNKARQVIGIIHYLRIQRIENPNFLELFAANTNEFA